MLKPSETKPVLILVPQHKPTIRLSLGVNSEGGGGQDPDPLAQLRARQTFIFILFFNTTFSFIFSFMSFFFRLCAELVSYKVLDIKMSLYRCPAPATSPAHPAKIKQTTHTVQPPPLPPLPPPTRQSAFSWCFVVVFFLTLIFFRFKV